MTKEEIAYFKSKTKEQLRYEKYAIKQILVYFKTTYAHVSELLDNYSVEETINILESKNDRDQLLLILGTIYTTVGISAFTSAYSSLKASLSSDTTDSFGLSLWKQKLTDIIRSPESIIRTDSIHKTTLDHIKKIFDKGKELNLTVNKLKTLLRKNILGTYALNRSKLIALTETSYIANTSEEDAAIYVSRELNVVLEKKWMRIFDERLRNSHHNVTTEYIGIESKFNVGGYQARMPYDKVLPIKEIAGCRCRLHYRKKEGGFI